MRKIKAFTLAEVLITLTIIGVVATLTIPPVMQSIQNTQHIVAWKKEFSTLSQATNKLITENGGTLQGVFNDSEDVRDKYLTKLSYIKKCDNTDESCWPSTVYNLNGDVSPFDLNAPTAVLSDGTFLKFWLEDKTCANGTWRCGWILVDVNGSKGPNTMGRDIFIAGPYSKRFVPDGNMGITDCDTLHEGYTCSAKYLMQ